MKIRTLDTLVTNFAPESVVSYFAKSLALLDKRSKKNLLIIGIIQSVLSSLDLIGVALMGLLAAISVRGIQSGKQVGRAETFLEYFNMENLKFQEQVALIAGIATTVLILRTLMSIYFNRRILFFLSSRAGHLSSQIMKQVLNDRDYLGKHDSSQAILYAVTEGVLSITVGIIGTGISLFTDSILLVVILSGLFVVDPILAVSSISFFGIVGVALYLMLYKKARDLGRESSTQSIASHETILETMLAYKEIQVRGRAQYYLDKITTQRLAISRVSAEMAFMPSVSKYVLEISVILGALLISLVQFVTHDATHAISSLLIFMAAGTRVAPAILRTQQGALQIKANIGGAKPTFDLLSKLDLQQIYESHDAELDTMHSGFKPQIHVQDLTFSFEGGETPVLKNINFDVDEGQVLAIAGPSGGGKTTLVDLILGLRPISSGGIAVSGILPKDAIHIWPGSIAYVPQQVHVINASIKANIALGFEENQAPEDHYWECLRVAQLFDFVRNLPQGLHTKVGESGARMSGGQKQRLGIARALFTNPKLLILDEATSSLDDKTESIVSDAILEMRGERTIIVIAHRLSTIKNADKVIYLSNGIIESTGTFDQVRKTVPDFDYQIKTHDKEKAVD